MELRFEALTPDGRTIDVYADGPEGAPALLFHNGTPGSGQLYRPFVEAATQRGLRMVSFSRAGYGDSTRDPGRSVADVATDVAVVLDQVGADRYYAVGWSGGGPHALACAALMPGRIIGAATVGGLAPYDAQDLDWMSGMDDKNVAAFSAALAGESEVRRLIAMVAPSFVNMTADQVGKGLGTLVSGVDRAAINGEAAEWLADVFRESVRHGIDGWVDDELALVRPWGFSFDDIGVPVAVWQGALDRQTPFAHGEWLATHIPMSEAHLLPDHGHLSLGVGSFGLILDNLSAIAPA